jgi:hypothetical protein
MAILTGEVIEPEIDKLRDSLKNIARSSGGLTKGGAHFMRIERKPTGVSDRRQRHAPGWISRAIRPNR